MTKIDHKNYLQKKLVFELLVNYVIIVALCKKISD